MPRNKNKQELREIKVVVRNTETGKLVKSITTNSNYAAKRTKRALQASIDHDTQFITME